MRAILMALAIGAIITSAAAFSISTSGIASAGLDHSSGPLVALHAQRQAREAQRARVEARYVADRSRCASLRGAQRDQCLIDAHAGWGRAMLAAAEPYEARH